ncbi:MFS multidrug transporter-like protein [Massarina eburnea CBS 473.64]|uniref:MFS multidrug transporter-like protein n=1 Tax=Massarina eburnea CBS 473.64 TaxID=1395130 RepID=A0A6A6SA36_9PLEO|nr:MFS multidrug transporter-like protein [Massarina eburnea CBS 473.64]
MRELTRTRTSPRNPDDFPFVQLLLLSLVRVAEPIALTSIFPYAIRLASYYGIPESQGPFFAGILISAFSLAEACTGMFWGGLSDRLGRKPVLLLGCFGTISSLLVVGFAPSFWVALCGRIVGGVLNGNIGVIQTMVGELVQNPAHEPKAYAVMPFVWSIGTIVGPSIGGYFAEPARNFPSIISSSGIFAKFPYLLPNLICTGLLVIAMIAGYVLLEETHPDMQPWSTEADLDSSAAETPLLPAQGATANAPANLTTECYGTFDAVDMQRDELWHVRSNGEWIGDTPSNDKVVTRTVLTFVAALGIFTYHSVSFKIDLSRNNQGEACCDARGRSVKCLLILLQMTYDHLLPIYFQDKRADDVSVLSISSNSLGGGLGIPLQDVGIIMSVNGLIQLFIQGAIFPVLASWFGVWRLLVIVTIGHPIAYFIVPFLPLLPQTLLYPGIYTCLAIRSLTSIVAYPLLLIMIKEAAPSPAHLGKINGLAASTGAACRTMASPIAGLLYGLSIEMHFTPIAWWASALVALFGAMQIPFMSRAASNCNPRVQTAARCCLSKKDRIQRHSVVHITVEEETA